MGKNKMPSRNKSCHVYILKCSDSTLYTGITTDLKKRIKQHNGTGQGGAKYTAGRRPVSLVYFEKYKTHREAARREYQIKQMSRTEKKELIKAVKVR